MKLAIDQIGVEDNLRIRKDVGNIESLKESISQIGLINPIIVDENNNLVAGYRRLLACKDLGWDEIDVKIVAFDGDLLKMHDVEVAENFFRKGFTSEEILASEKRRQEILEQLREKGFWERVWLWLKGLFRFEVKPVTEPEPAGKELEHTEAEIRDSEEPEEPVKPEKPVALAESVKTKVPKPIANKQDIEEKEIFPQLLKG